MRDLHIATLGVFVAGFAVLLWLSPVAGFAMMAVGLLAADLTARKAGAR